MVRGVLKKIILKQKGPIGEEKSENGWLMRNDRIIVHEILSYRHMYNMECDEPK